jgi:signal recognition particle receptor subunit beta
MAEATPDSDGIDLSASKLLVKFAKPVVTYAWYWLRGYKVVLVGPPLAGKTRFLRFLYTLQLLPDHKNEYERAQDRTLHEHKEGLVVLRIGEPGRIVLPLRAVVDTPGRNEGNQHAELLIDSRHQTAGAHALVIVLDGSDPEQAVRWITEFGQRLTEILRHASKLCEVFVIINKFDKCHESYDVVYRDIRNALVAALAPAIADRASQVKILKAILVKHPDAIDLLNIVFQELAFVLRRPARQRTFDSANRIGE